MLQFLELTCIPPMDTRQMEHGLLQFGREIFCDQGTAVSTSVGTGQTPVCGLSHHTAQPLAKAEPRSLHIEMGGQGTPALATSWGCYLSLWATSYGELSSGGITA